MGLNTLVVTANEMFLILCTLRIATEAICVFFMFLAKNRVFVGQDKFKKRIHF